jgi:hypothetical protein
MNLSTEIYQFLFISSIIFMVYVLGDLAIKMYGRFALKKETRFVLTKSEKILLLLSLATFLTYIIK